MLEIMIVVGIIGILAVIAMPAFLRARLTSQKTACSNNLRQLDYAKNQWAIETGQGTLATPGWSDVGPYIKGGLAKMYCPADSTKQATNSYSINILTTNPTCLVQSTTHIL